MLVYEKKVDGERHLFGVLEGRIPSADDAQLTFKDAEGNELELELKDVYLNDGKGGIIRKKDGAVVNVFIGDTQIIGEEIEVEPTTTPAPDLTPDPEPEITVTGISVTTKPTKLAYTEGESLDLTGMVVTAFGTDGTQGVNKVLTADEYLTTPVDGAVLTTDTTGEIEVVVSAYDFEDTFTITVATGEPELDPEPGE